MISHYYIYNKVEDGFLKIKESNPKKHRGFKSFKSVKSIFSHWGPLVETSKRGEVFTIDEKFIFDKAFIRTLLQSLKISNDIKDFVIVPQNKQETTPDFQNAIDLLVHFDEIDQMDVQYLP